jgi:hypothetical protein
MGDYGDYKDYEKRCNGETYEGNDASTEFDGYINSILTYSLTNFFQRQFIGGGDQSMRPWMLPFSQVIEQKRRRWIPFRCALSKEDQAAFDRMFACATQPL